MNGAHRAPSRGRPRIRAPHGRGVWIAAAAIAMASLAVAAVREATASASHPDSIGSAAPTFSIEGGEPEHRQTVRSAVARFASVGLELPDLRIHIHSTGKAACSGFQGSFRADGDVALIDLCYPGELLVLHELGHAWERFNLDDPERLAFQRLTGLTTWRSTEVVWRDRGAERAANAIAHGLLSTPITNLRYHTSELAEFEALTGSESPRVAEAASPGTTLAPVDDEQRARLAAYNEWRHARATG